jgi:hypothetical protein
MDGHPPPPILNRVDGRLSYATPAADRGNLFTRVGKVRYIPRQGVGTGRQMGQSALGTPIFKQAKI